ncbi:MAG: hypothetical protein KF832_27835 [Caldilineaceae bacterium]|nr:hypothetical protein [Caldilineaceae bacterium]
MNKRVVLAALVGLLAFTIYWGTARYFGHAETPDVAYFNHLADAFLQGRLYLAAPPNTHDLTQYAGRWYVPFPPLPALLMLPSVALLGVAQVNTVFFVALFGAANVALIFLLLSALARQQWTQLSTGDNLWLTLLFGLGCVHWYMATIGSVWFVAQICTVTFVALAVWLAIEGRSPWLVGSALALAVAGRPNTLLTWPLLFGIAATHLRTQQPRLDWPRLLRWAGQTALPLFVVIGALLLYNQARFGNPLDFGYVTENVADELAPDLHYYGQFHLHYLPKNLWAMALAGPQWDDEINFWKPDPQGMSLLLTTPALLYLARARTRSWLVIGGWTALLLLLVPLALYYNTGWWQFGYRFSLDFMTPVMVLLALAASTRISGAMRFLILAGVMVNFYGVLWWHL